jgi:hypothetical protein
VLEDDPIVARFAKRGRSMNRLAVWLVPLLAALSGCGPSAAELRERTLSTLNIEADKWDGGKDFATAATDAYGRPVTSAVSKGMFSYALELRSSGPDGLPKNSDDVVVTRSKNHGETSLTKEAEKAAESIGRGATTGVIEGVKKGLAGGADKK